jgi:hypothetical protein
MLKQIGGKITVSAEERCRFCGFWHLLPERRCCTAAAYAAELENRLEWSNTVSIEAQEQVHALAVLARKHSIPQAEIDDAMLVGCLGCPLHPTEDEDTE